MKNQRQLTALGFFLLALGLRLRGLSNISFWFDELWTATRWTSPSTLIDVWHKLWLPAEGNLPLYPFFINLWSFVFGTSELSLIAPSILFGSAAVSVMFLLAEKRWGYFSGIFAAGLVATLSNPLFFSQEARGYSLVLFLVTLNLYSRDQKKLWATSALLLCWAHYFGIFFIGLQFIVDFIKRREWLKYYPLPLVGLTPVIPLIIYQLQHSPTFPSDKHLPEFWNWIFDTDLEFLTYILVGSLFLQSINALLFKKDQRELLLYIYAPYILIISWNLFLSPITSKRYFISIIPPAILLISGMIFQLENLRPKLTRIFCSIILFVSFICSLTTDIRKSHKFPRLKEALNFISLQKNTTLFVRDHDRDLWEYYLKDHKNIQVITNIQDISTFWFIDLSYSKRSELNGLKVIQKKEIGLTSLTQFTK